MPEQARKRQRPVTAVQTDQTKVVGRRRFLQYAGAVMTLAVTTPGALAAGAAAAVGIVAVRVWPAKDYTRVTLEYKDPLSFNQFLVKDPHRLVVDLEGVEFNSVLQSLPSKISEADPHIKLIRAGRFKPGTVRLVIDLKDEVKPQVFTLKPVGDYGYRLVMDLYPSVPVDPLAALLEKTPAAQSPEPAKLAERKPDKRDGRDGLDELLEKRGEGQSRQEVADARNARPTKPEKVEKVEKTEPAEIGGKQDMAAEVKAEPKSEPRVEPKASSKSGQPVVNRLVTIVIDPGHGGEDPGAIGKAGSREKDVTLAVGRRLKARIDAQPNMRTLLTRDADFFVPLQERVAKARRVQADLFVSIHADAFIKSTVKGSSVFVLSEHGASSVAARMLAQHENDSDLIGGVNITTKDANLARTLLDLSQAATQADSVKLANAVLGELGHINTLHSGRIEEAGFAVLKAPDIPSILVETAFISNPEEEQRLIDDAYQERMADAILKGIRKYFAKNPPQAKSKLA